MGGRVGAGLVMKDIQGDFQTKPAKIVFTKDLWGPG